MPGVYAKAMLDVQSAGRWPVEYITLMLHYNTMHGNFAGNLHDINYQMCTDNNALASCHPNAIMFMNVVSDANYVNDMTPAVMVSGGAAANYIAQAQAAVMLDDQAIWVKYGSSDGHSHSIILLTGRDNQIEPLEGWAGTEGYFFHESVLAADRLGDGHLPRPARAVAQARLGQLIADAVADREEGWDALSRSGAGYAPRANEVPHVCVRVANMVTVAEFKNAVVQRLRMVGFYRAIAAEGFQRLFVCCRCQTTTWYRWTAHQWGWRECPQCARHYCQQCCRVLLEERCDCWRAFTVAM